MIEMKNVLILLVGILGFNSCFWQNSKSSQAVAIGETNEVEKCLSIAKLRYPDKVFEILEIDGDICKLYQKSESVKGESSPASRLVGQRMLSIDLKSETIVNIPGR